MNHPSKTKAAGVRFLHIFPSYGLGGAELRVSRIINQMGASGRHAILSISGTMAAAQHLDPDCKVQLFTAPPKVGAVRFPIDLWRCIRQINPAVILTYNWGATDAIIGARCAGFRPVIHNECGLSADIDGKGWRRRLMRRVLLPSCYRVVVTSHTFYNMAIDGYGVPKHKVAFIKTGVDTNRFAPGTNSELRHRIAPANSGTVFGYVGSLRPSKNVAMLVKAFAAARQPGDRLALFGEGPERQHLATLITDLDLQEAVCLHGHISAAEHAYHAIDVNVTASRSEAASNSLLESMACGLPSVSTDIADNRIILSEENRKFVYAHEDFDGYVKGLRTMAADELLRRELGQANRHRVVTEYPIDRMYHEYASLWESAAMLAGRSLSPSHEDPHVQSPSSVRT